MSNFEVKTQVKTTQDILLIDGRPYRDGFTRETMTAIGGSFTTAGLPVASGLTDGLLAYDSTRKCLVVTASGAWAIA
jgi:hypothetical protein